MKVWVAGRSGLTPFRTYINEPPQAKAAQDRQASYYDAGWREPDFKPGDSVWKRSHTLSSAAKGIVVTLAPKFEGPYWVTAVLGSNTYTLVSDGGQVEELEPADHLKPYHGESPESNEVGAEGGSGKAPAGDLPISQEAGATPKRTLERPLRAYSDATATAEPPSVGQGVANAPRRGRGRPNKNP